MKVRLVEWRLHELGDLELDTLPTDTFEYQGLAFTVETIEFGGQVTLVLRRKDDGKRASLIDFHLSTPAMRSTMSLRAVKPGEMAGLVFRRSDRDYDDAVQPDVKGGENLNLIRLGVDLQSELERELEMDREAEKGSWLPRGDDVEDDDATNE